MVGMKRAELTKKDLFNGRRRYYKIECIHGVTDIRNVDYISHSNRGKPGKYDCQCNGRKLERLKATNMSKYGVDHVMQNPDIRRKNVQSLFTVKRCEWERRPSTECHGYDDRLFDYLRTIYTEEDIDVSNSIAFPYMVDKNSHKYFPDAIVAGRVYEAKSTLTMMKDRHLTRLKANAVLARGYEYHILLFISTKQFFRFIYREKEVFVIYPTLYLDGSKKRSNNVVIFGEPRVFIKPNTMQHTNTEDTAPYPSAKVHSKADLASGSVTGTKRFKRKRTATTKRQNNETMHIDDSDSDFAPYPSSKVHSKGSAVAVGLASGSVTVTKPSKRGTETTKTPHKKMKYINDSDSDFGPKAITDTE